MDKSGISGSPNQPKPWPLQIYKWFPINIIIFEKRSTFLRMICMKKNVFLAVFRRLFVQVVYRIFDRSSKIIMLMGNHLYICNDRGLRNFFAATEKVFVPLFWCFKKVFAPLVQCFIPKFMKTLKLVILDPYFRLENLKMAWNQWYITKTKFFLLSKNLITFSKTGL